MFIDPLMSTGGNCSTIGYSVSTERRGRGSDGMVLFGRAIASMPISRRHEPNEFRTPEG